MDFFFSVGCVCVCAPRIRRLNGSEIRDGKTCDPVDLRDAVFCLSHASEVIGKLNKVKRQRKLFHCPRWK